MRSTVTTATAPPKEPVERKAAVEAEDEKTDKEQSEYDRFLWTYTEEPHRTRRQAIIKAHPEAIDPPKHAGWSSVLTICR